MKELFNNLDLVDIIQFVVYLIFSLLLFFKSGNKKYLEDFMKKIENRDAFFMQSTPTQGQSFNKLKPVYRLDKSTNTLIQTDEFIDMQEIIDSCKDQTLDAVLERFFPESALTDSQLQVNKMQDDLDIVADIVNKANEYRIKFNLDPTLSVTDVFKHVNEQSNLLKEKIKNLEAQKNEKKKIIEESK